MAITYQEAYHTEKHILGRKLAELYIACQEGVSYEVSCMALKAMEDCSPFQKLGFNQVMEKSKYNVRA